jgi:hypothetical protein
VPPVAVILGGVPAVIPNDLTDPAALDAKNGIVNYP